MIRPLIGESGRLFLAVIIDLFSPFTAGYGLSAVDDRPLAIKAMEMAVWRRCPDEGLLHHSDQGSAYASEEYQKQLEVAGIVCSMSRRGNFYDSAAMASWFRTLKSELGERFESYSETNEKLFDYIEVFYNQRIHSSIGYVGIRAWRHRIEAHGRQRAHRLHRPRGPAALAGVYTSRYAFQNGVGRLKPGWQSVNWIG